MITMKNVSFGSCFVKISKWKRNISTSDFNGQLPHILVICLFPILSNFCCVLGLFLFLSGFSFTDTDDSQDSRGREWTIFLFHPTTSTRSQTLRQLFATLHVRWLSRIFNFNAWVSQTPTRWNLPPYRITIWLIDRLMTQCLFVYLMNWF